MKQSTRGRMTPEEFKRAMDFIIEQLARFEAAIERESAKRDRQWERDQPRIARVEASLVAIGELNVLTSELIQYQARAVRVVTDGAAGCQRHALQIDIKSQNGKGQQ